MTEELERLARRAAHAYWAGLELPAPERIDAPPVLGPVTLPGEQGADERVAYRFIGPGRGGDYVQVELDLAAMTATVHGAVAGGQQPTQIIALGDGES